MRTIVHLSDLHFGRTDDTLLAPLAAAVAELGPDLVAVSGDLTQRARSAEFIAARAFLDRLPQPQIVVPGNHDVPLHDIFRRFLAPLDKYRRYITADLEPFYADEQIAALGINTARSLTFKRGRINVTQVDRAKARLCSLDPEIVRIIVTHHPFDVPEGLPAGERVGRSRLATEMLSGCRCDLLLAGHLHISDSASVAMNAAGGSHQAIVVQAGTATSTRGRGEINSFNAIHIETNRIEVFRHGWNASLGLFEPVDNRSYKRTAAGWRTRLAPAAS
jgi:3',5'-cyclic AMP phosphodiesterase CpdA